VIDGVEAERAEGEHQPSTQVAAVGLERGRLPPVLAAAAGLPWDLSSSSAGSLGSRGSSLTRSW
jgi:hypothetical protein